ncbi:MAG: membrane-bound lytic murein transglycosylase D [Marinoscillum sp.]|jgi:membrane-bound lytic murein transglycosylase D
MRLLIVLCFFLTSGIVQAQYPIDYDHIPDATYEEVADRLNCIQSEIPLNYNEKVKSFIDYFTIRDRPYTLGVMERLDVYFPIFEKALARYNVPNELKYLAIVESGLRTNAVSRANAVGLWQFMSSTGKMYGLSNDWYLDDRMDPYAASDAAARHLRDLFSTFGDWELAMAAYNCGSGNVRKAIRKSGYKEHFWEIYDYLPRETRSYVPQFVAIAYTIHYADEHNLIPSRKDKLPESDTIMVSQYFHLETFAAQLNICLGDMLLLNPSIKRGVLPEGTKNFTLRIPADIKEQVVSNRFMLYDTASKVGKEHLDYLARSTPGSTYGREKQVYRVRRGDVLGAIANKYNVGVADIKEWNNLSSNMILVGQYLKIYVLPTYSSDTKDLYAQNTTTNTSAISADKKFHYVQVGDTLWDIAKNYNGLSIDRLKQLNNLSTNTIQPGQRLIISTQ